MTCYPHHAGGGRTGGAAAAQTEPPEPATDPSPAGKSTRKVRCRVLDRKRNPCPNEALDDEGICYHHLESITLHWCNKVAELFGVFGGDDQNRLLAIVNTLKRYCGGTT